MALSEKAKQDIIEEETLRYETRSKLAEASGKCGHGKCGSRSGCRCAWWGWAVAAVLGLLLLFNHCPMKRGCGPMGMDPARCKMMMNDPRCKAMMAEQDAIEKEQAPAAKPAPAAKADKK